MQNKKAPRGDTSAKAKNKGKEVAKRRNKQAKEGEYRGLVWESGCELACLHFLFILKDQGYVHSIGRGETFLLSDAVTHNYSVPLKRGSKVVQQLIWRGHSYSDDFVVHFTRKALGVFAWTLGSNCKFDPRWFVVHPTADPDLFLCHIEVKPDFSFQGKTEKAVNDMKWVFQKYGIWVNLFKPAHRFNLCFTPEEYKITERGKSRKLNYKVRSLADYLKAA